MSTLQAAVEGVAVSAASVRTKTIYMPVMTKHGELGHNSAGAFPRRGYPLIILAH